MYAVLFVELCLVSLLSRACSCSIRGLELGCVFFSIIGIYDGISVDWGVAFVY